MHLDGDALAFSSASTTTRRGPRCSTAGEGLRVQFTTTALNGMGAGFPRRGRVKRAAGPWAIPYPRLGEPLLGPEDDGLIASGRPRGPTPMEIDQFLGLPAHPLVVHLPVVFIPLTCCSIRPSRRARGRGVLSLVVAGAATISMLGAQVAVMSGKSLEAERVRETSLVHQHAELGEGARTLAILMFIAAVAFVVREWRDRLRVPGRRAPAADPRPPRGGRDPQHRPAGQRRTDDGVGGAGRSHGGRGLLQAPCPGATERAGAPCPREGGGWTNGITPYPVRYTNRESSDSRGYSLDGDYFLRVSANLNLDEPSTTPYLLTVVISGDPEPGPVYLPSGSIPTSGSTTPTTPNSSTPASSTSASVTSSSSESTTVVAINGTGATTGSTVNGLLWAALGAGVVLVIGLAGWLIARGRRPANGQSNTHL